MQYSNVPSNKYRQNEYPGTTSGSESSISDDGVKAKKRRSHRPRGCRGGGSRRARKQRREQEFLAKKERENYIGVAMTDITTENKQNSLQNDKSQEIKSPLKQLQNIHYHRQVSNNNVSTMNNTTGLSISDALPVLQMNSSQASRETAGHAAKNNLDILPNLQTAQTAQTYDSTCIRYKTMNPLPPISLSNGSSGHGKIFTMRQYPYQQHMNNDYSTTVSLEQLSAYSTTVPNIEGYIVHTNNIIKNNVGVQNNVGELRYKMTNDRHNVERIKKQQEILAGGGSFFAISPRSFLFGKKKVPTFCF